MTGATDWLDRSSAENDIIMALLSAMHGPQPFNPRTDVPTDVGLGGPSTEYLMGTQDPMGNEVNYPQIWWQGGQPTLLNPDQAYDRSVQYEQATGLMAPRYRNDGAATFAAENRSALGGAEVAPLFLRGYPGGNF